MLQHILQAADIVALAAGYDPIENGECISRLDAVRQAGVEPPQTKIREVDSLDAVTGILCHLQQEPFAASYLKEFTFRRVAGRHLRNGVQCHATAQVALFHFLGRIRGLVARGLRRLIVEFRVEVGQSLRIGQRVDRLEPFGLLHEPVVGLLIHESRTPSALRLAAPPPPHPDRRPTAPDRAAGSALLRSSARPPGNNRA